MQKCNRYPNCECYNDWEEPAKKINPASAELFTIVMQEIRIFFDTTYPVKFLSVLEEVKDKLEVLPQDLHGLLLRKILSIVEFDYLWKMTEKSDLIKLKKAFIKEISVNYELEYYTDKKNIPNQNLVKETIEYFEKGAGARAFKPLEFLNFFESQWKFVIANWINSDVVISHLKALPLNEIEKHILFGLILKWLGGYPISEAHESDPKVGITKKAIEKEFLDYEGETPEKIFCKVNNESRRHFDKLGIAFTAAMNNNIDVKKILDAMSEIRPQEKIYYSFDEMFEDAARNDALGEFENRQTFLIERSKYNFEFNVWLQETKGFEYGNESQYQAFLLKDIFMEFLRYKNIHEQQFISELEKEKASWQVKPYQQEDKTDVVKLIMERSKLSDLLSVPAPDVLHKDAFWHGENNSPIDCNIYHPKYGYPGLETTSKDIIITSFNNATIYQEERTGKYIYCKYFLQVLCTADEVNFVNKDGKKIIKVDFTQKYQKKLAENEQDFELIYKKELEDKKITNLETKKIFHQELVAHTQGLIQLHKKNSSYKDGRDINLLTLADGFIKFLENKLVTSVPNETTEEIEQPDLEEILTEIKNKENLFWKGLPMEQVIKHFEVMTIRKNKKGNKFLTTEQLISFLKKGFLNDTKQVTQKINCSNGEKGLVIKRFYEFFVLAVSQYGHIQQKKKFIKLFTDCFDNWEQSTIEPFFKPNKTKETW